MLPSLTSFVLCLATLSIASASSSSKKQVKKNAAEDNPDDPTGKILYITEPACGYYRCTVTWKIGEEVAVNWLGPPGGNVAVSLMSNIGGPTYPIVNNIAGTSQEGYCDSGYGLGVVAPGHECGRVQFVVPSGWQKMDNYTIVVQSLDHPDEVGYTDMITIAAADSSNSNGPSGTSVSLATIAAPTSTNYGASQKPDISIPSPTAGTGQPSSSAAPRSSASSAMVSSRANQSSSIASSTTGTTVSSASFASAASAGASSSTPSSSQTPSSAASSNFLLHAGPAFFFTVAVAMCLV